MIHSRWVCNGMRSLRPENSFSIQRWCACVVEFASHFCEQMRSVETISTGLYCTWRMPNDFLLLFSCLVRCFSFSSALILCRPFEVGKRQRRRQTNFSKKNALWCSEKHLSARKDTNVAAVVSIIFHIYFFILSRVSCRLVNDSFLAFYFCVRHSRVSFFMFCSSFVGVAFVNSLLLIHF